MELTGCRGLPYTSGCPASVVLLNQLLCEVESPHFFRDEETDKLILTKWFVLGFSNYVSDLLLDFVFLLLESPFLRNRYSYMHGPRMGIIPNKLNSCCLLRVYRLKHIISQLLTWRVPLNILILFRITK